MKFDEATAIKIGAADIAAAYLGSSKLWPSKVDALKFSAESATSIRTTALSGTWRPNLQYSYDGTTWETLVYNTDYAFGTNEHPYIYVRGSNVFGVCQSSRYGKFVFGGGTAVPVVVSGDYRSLISYYPDAVTAIPQYCFKTLFSNSPVSEVPDFPVCPIGMHGCDQMFSYCHNLTKMPCLPSETLYDYCYYLMFRGCSNLYNVGAGILCRTLAAHCCEGMFKGCTALIEAPTLWATTLANSSYQEMFSGCSSLRSVICYLESATSGNLYNWMSDVYESGIFTKKAGVTYPSGVSGIPEGWTVLEI